ncbi:MAG TPA: ATP-binding protein, partial [Anaeromyxobacteraceae bacterium]|nr:ATP-binding protein [Anaeromyxobacteraceae bacterium]
FEKPPLVYWLTAVSFKAFGIHEWSARALPALSGLLGIVMAYVLGRAMFDPWTGQAAAALLAAAPPSRATLAALMRSNGLEGASLLSPSLQVLADATGPAGGRADLLRVDERRVAAALAGDPSVAFAYAVGDQPVATGYFPVRGPGGEVEAVLALEAGHAVSATVADLERARGVGVALSALVAAALAAAALQWARSEARRQADAARAARGEALSRMAAMVAHELRNPVAVVRGAVELVQARAGATLPPRDRDALQDVLGEVDRLTRLTQDFLDLSREPALSLAPADLAELAAEAARGLARSHPAVEVRLAVPALPVEADPGRLRQLLANLLVNAAQAGARVVELRGAAGEGRARLVVADDGPGVPEALRPRLFDPFATGRAEGTGLGLAISRRIAERHGGALRLVDGAGPGATFELTLPLGGG